MTLALAPAVAMASVPDFIDTFMAYTDGIPSPAIFRLWSGICAIGGAIERRCWVETSRSVLYPNLFVLLVGPPGSGKTQAIDQTSELWLATKKLKIAPNNMTSAALVDALREADRKILRAGGLIEYHSLLIPCSELGVFVPEHDNAFLSILNYIYDNPRTYREQRRHFNAGKETEVIHPQINILAGTQPGFLASLLPEAAWSMGFTSRIIMIYAHTSPRVDIFGEDDPRTAPRQELTKMLVDITQLIGKFLWRPEAAHELERWAREGCPPVPSHARLVHYNSRRILHTLKLSMISAVSRSRELVIELVDVRRARDWLLQAEHLMPDVFREMIQRSDSQVLHELHYFMWSIWIKEKKPLHEARLISFLSNRVPGEKVLRLLEIAERSNLISRDAGTKLYTPKPRHEHGLE